MMGILGIVVNMESEATSINLPNNVFELTIHEDSVDVIKNSSNAKVKVFRVDKKQGCTPINSRKCEKREGIGRLEKDSLYQAKKNIKAYKVRNKKDFKIRMKFDIADLATDPKGETLYPIYYPGKEFQNFIDKMQCYNYPGYDPANDLCVFKGVRKGNHYVIDVPIIKKIPKKKHDHPHKEDEKEFAEKMKNLIIYHIDSHLCDPNPAKPWECQT